VREVEGIGFVTGIELENAAGTTFLSC